MELEDYGDLTVLNKCRELHDAVGRETLDRIVHSCIDLLDTSAAIYEADGSYATALFSSSYCMFMDRTSRYHCDTDNNAEALSSGKWICHESCWNKAARVALETKKPHDLIPCDGGVNLFAVPIITADKVIGVISVGYGTPPADESTINELADKYNVDPASLLEKAKEYIPRPDFINEAAKKHILLAAELLAELYARKKAEGKLNSLNNELEIKVEERTKEIHMKMKELQNFKNLIIGREERMIDLKVEINDLLKKLGREPKYIILE